MKPAAIGFMLVAAICLIAVLDKDADKVPGANYVGVKSGFVPVGLGLNATPATRTTSHVPRTTSTTAKGKPASRKATPQYPINVPY